MQLPASTRSKRASGNLTKPEFRSCTRTRHRSCMPSTCCIVEIQLRRSWICTGRPQVNPPFSREIVLKQISTSEFRLKSARALRRPKPARPRDGSREREPLWKYLVRGSRESCWCLDQWLYFRVSAPGQRWRRGQKRQGLLRLQSSRFRPSTGCPVS